MKIRVKNNNVESALRALKRKTKDSLMELKDKQYYEKKSAKRNKAKASAKKRKKKRQREENAKH